MLGLLDQFWTPVVRVTPLKTPFGLLLLLFQSQSHVTTFTHNYLPRCYTCTQLTITYTFVTIITCNSRLHCNCTILCTVHCTIITTYSRSNLPRLNVWDERAVFIFRADESRLYSSTLKIDVADTSETSIPTYQITWHHFQKTSSLPSQRGDSVKRKIITRLCASLS
jgi:hypothetical protein